MKSLLTLLALSLLAFPGSVAAQAVLVNSFETPADLSMVNTSNCTTSTTTTIGVTNGSQALQVNFLPSTYPTMTLIPTSTWSWSGYGGVALDVTNPGAAPVNFSVSMDDSVVSDTWVGSSTAAPGATTSFFLPFAPAFNPIVYGVRVLPPAYPGTTSLGYYPNSALDFGHIANFRVFLHQPATTTSLIFDNVRLIPAVNPATFLSNSVDAYGQNNLQNYTGKMPDPSVYPSRISAESSAISANPGPPSRDSYGGWSAGPSETATGNFYTKHLNGKWWLVDPIGNLFFTVGMNTVDNVGATLTTGRTNMFTYLPVSPDPLAAFNGTVTTAYGFPSGGSTYNYYSANLQRKYGANNTTQWQQMAVKRLQSWGFNTLGAFTTWSLYYGHTMPYTMAWTSDMTHAHVSAGNSSGSLPDPFDPQVATTTASQIQYYATTYKFNTDTNCIGHYMDNELGWTGVGPTARYGLAYGAMNLSSSSSPAKQAFLAQLQAQYSTIGAFNLAWGTSVASWAALGSPFAAPTIPTAAQKSDMSAFVLSFARKYFNIMRAAIKGADPNHLYLGCRFATNVFSPEVVQAAGEICDVVSFNLYQPTIDPNHWAFLSALNKPCIASEFHFGATDRGMFSPGLVDGETQAGRAAGYQAYVQSAAANPLFIGCHYFRYIDEPLTGVTTNGEDYGVGFVDVTDTPYPELVSAAQTENASVYTQRYGP